MSNTVPLLTAEEIIAYYAEENVEWCSCAYRMHIDDDRTACCAVGVVALHHKMNPNYIVGDSDVVAVSGQPLPFLVGMIYGNDGLAIHVANPEYRDDPVFHQGVEVGKAIREHFYEQE